MLTNDIVTQRLILRSTREEWGPLCLELWLDPEMGRYLADPPREKADADYLSFGRGIEQEEGWFPLCGVFPGDRGADRHVQRGPHRGGGLLGSGLCGPPEPLAAGLLYGNAPGADGLGPQLRRPGLFRLRGTGKRRLQRRDAEAWLPRGPGGGIPEKGDGARLSGVYLPAGGSVGPCHSPPAGILRGAIFFCGNPAGRGHRRAARRDKVPPRRMITPRGPTASAPPVFSGS